MQGKNCSFWRIFLSVTTNVVPLAGAALSITWRNGMLYGTTGAGDTDLDGSVFQLAPQGDTWVETVLYNFVNTDGTLSYGPAGA